MAVTVVKIESQSFSSAEIRARILRGNAAIAVEGEQNAVDHCGNDGNFLPCIVQFLYYSLCITTLILEFRC